MKKTGIILIVVLLIVGFLGMTKYNGFVSQEENLKEKWANVETVYQKRANLIPNLEKAVKSYAKFESNTLTQVIEARSKATSITIDPTNMTEQDLERFQAAQGELSGALSRLMAVVEQYPDLKASQQYTNFQREYTAIENSLRTETVYYNKAVNQYNNAVRKMPDRIIASVTGFHEKPTFKSEVGADKAPEVFSEE